MGFTQTQTHILKLINGKIPLNFVIFSLSLQIRVLCNCTSNYGNYYFKVLQFKTKLTFSLLSFYMFMLV